MKYEIKNKEIHITVPAAKDGRFRFKTRHDNFKFGNSFATRQKMFDDHVYLEWQIGYDATVREVEIGKKL